LKEKLKNTPSEVKRLKENLIDEANAAYLYGLLADFETDEDRSSIFRELAEVEEGHAGIWRKKLEDLGEKKFEPGLTAKTRLLAFLARRMGISTVVPILQVIEKSAGGGYAGQEDPDATNMARVEKTHEKVFEGIQSGKTTIAEAESWHRGDSAGSLRAAIFGLNDGLVSNFSLIMGVAGAGVPRSGILITGLAGMLAGAFSMAAGEYVSVRSQRELFEHEIAREEEELITAPEEERKELELIYRAKGIPRETAVELSAKILENPESALDTLAREELGLAPDSLGSPWKVAFSSFLAFFCGAVLPIFPFFFLAGNSGVWVSAVISGLFLFLVGAGLSLFTGRSAWYSGFRMLFIGTVVAVITNSLGRLLGVAIG